MAAVQISHTICPDSFDMEREEINFALLQARAQGCTIHVQGGTSGGERDWDLIWIQDLTMEPHPTCVYPSLLEGLSARTYRCVDSFWARVQHDYQSTDNYRLCRVDRVVDIQRWPFTGASTAGGAMVISGFNRSTTCISGHSIAEVQTGNYD